MRNRALPAVLLALLPAAGFRPAAAGGEDSAPAGPAEVRVGLLLPADGTLAGEVSRGAALAASLLGTPESPVKIVERRVDGHWGSEAPRFVEMIYADRVAGLVTAPDRNSAHLAAQVSVKSGVPVVTCSAAAALTRIPLPWIFRAVPDERSVLEGMLATLSLEERARSPLLFHRGDREGERAAGEAAAVLRRAGAGAPRLFPCGPDGGGREPGVAAAILDEGRAAPVLLCLPGGVAAAVLRDLRAAGWKGRALGLPPEGLDPLVFAKSIGAAGDGLLLAQGFDPGAGEGASFRRAFRERFDGEPGAAAAAVFDAVRLLVRAARAGDGSPGAVRKALLEGGPLDGATGRIAFDGQGNRTGSVDIVELQDGALRRPRPDSERKP